MENLVFFFTGEKEIDDRKFTSVIIVLLSGYCFDIFLKYNSFHKFKELQSFETMLYKPLQCLQILLKELFSLSKKFIVCLFVSINIALLISLHLSI
jgi:uncharacterized membrane protein